MRLSGVVSIDEQFIVCKRESTSRSGFRTEGNSIVDGLCYERSRALQIVGSRLSRPGSFPSASQLDGYALTWFLGAG